MGEFLRSALDYIGGGQSGATAKDDTDLVGNVVEIEAKRFRVKRLLAEGLCVRLSESAVDWLIDRFIERSFVWSIDWSIDWLIDWFQSFWSFLMH